MKALATATLMGCILSASFAPAADDGTGPLQGVWRGTRFAKGDGADPSKGVALELTITGNHVVGKRLPQGSLGEGDIKLAGDGKSIDAVGTAGAFKGKLFPGIFKLEGTTLRWCLNSGGEPETRPAVFVADSSSDNWLMVLTKQ